MAQTPIGAGIGDAARMSMTVNKGKHKKSFSRHKLNADRMAKRSSAAYSHTGSVRIRPETAASIQVLFDAPKPYATGTKQQFRRSRAALKGAKKYDQINSTWTNKHSRKKTIQARSGAVQLAPMDYNPVT